MLLLRSLSKLMRHGMQPLDEHELMGWTLTQNKVISSFSAIETNVTSPLLSEGLALRVALHKISNLGIVSLSVQADSKTLIDNIVNKNPVSELYGVVSDILCIGCTFETISFRWISSQSRL
ncbi:unnamed protein product [Brassica oleracea var. botrytis]